MTFDDERDAEDAMRDLNNTTLVGSRIHIEWAKSSGRGPGRRSDECYRCGEVS